MNIARLWKRSRLFSRRIKKRTLGDCWLCLPRCCTVNVNGDLQHVTTSPWHRVTTDRRCALSRDWSRFDLRRLVSLFCCPASQSKMMVVKPTFSMTICREDWTEPLHCSTCLQAVAVSLDCSTGVSTWSCFISNAYSLVVYNDIARCICSLSLSTVRPRSQINKQSWHRGTRQLANRASAGLVPTYCWLI